jgi:prepilin-type processing-associated H-X9-DG protein
MVICALLMSLSLPLLAQTRSSARLIACSGNTKSLAVAFFAYDARAGSFPHASSAASAQLPSVWLSALDLSPNTALRSRSPLWCPARCIADGVPSVLVGNYGVNRSICPVLNSSAAPRPLGWQSIRHPCRKLLLLDSGYYYVSSAQTAPLASASILMADDPAYIPGLRYNSKRKFRSAVRHDALLGRHPSRRLNAAFADGHSEALTPERLAEESPSRLWLP